MVDAESVECVYDKESPQKPWVLERNIDEDVGISVAVAVRSPTYVAGIAKGHLPEGGLQHMGCMVALTSTRLTIAQVKPPKTMRHAAKLTQEPVSPSAPKPCSKRELAHCESEKYWKRRYIYWAKFDFGIQMDANAWFEMTPEPVAAHLATRLKDFPIVIDATCGIGGNAVPFAKYTKVIGVDLDGDRLPLAHANAAVYGVNLQLVCSDFMVWAEKRAARREYKLNENEVVFISPPWGGPACFDIPSFSLKQVSVPDICDMVDAAFKLTPHVVLYMPRNTDLNDIVAFAAARGISVIEVERIMLTRPNLHLKCIAIYFSRKLMQTRDSVKLSKAWHVSNQSLFNDTIRSPEVALQLPAFMDPALKFAGPIMRRANTFHYIGYHLARAVYLPVQLDWFTRMLRCHYPRGSVADLIQEEVIASRRSLEKQRD